VSSVAALMEKFRLSWVAYRDRCGYHPGYAHNWPIPRAPNLAGIFRFQLREDHWVVADLIREGKHIHAAPVPAAPHRAKPVHAAEDRI
jgi:hypothetical protein